MMAEIKYGLSATGFKRKRLPEIMQAINSRISDSLGLKTQIQSNSVLGQIVGVFSYEIADLWEQAENGYNAMYPSTAQGVSLSNAAGLAGIQLIDAEFTTLVATCFGANGTEIPYNAQITDGTNTYSCTDVYAQIDSARACVVGVKLAGAVAEGVSYSLTIDGVTQTYTAVSCDSATNVLVGLSVLFSFTDRTMTVNNEVMLIAMNDQAQTMNVAPGNTLVLSTIGSPFNFKADVAGALSPNIGSITQIVTSYAGWDSVENNVAAVVGRNAESDISLRQRWGASVFDRASAMVEAIRAALIQTDGVTFAIVYENDTDETDADGRPPHSIEAVVAGGQPQDIADTIWRTHAGGIATYGSQVVTVNDSQGIPHLMRFNRPTEVPIYLQITVTANPEKELSGAAIPLIQQAIVKQGAGLTVGQDVILQSFYGTVYQATSGAVGYMEIKGSTDGTTWSTDNIVMDARHLATFDAANISVTINA
jgi:uncharacterized phage protein gp47/JayE